MGSNNSKQANLSDVKAAVKELDRERKRLRHVSKSFEAQANYIEQLEELTSCLEKSLVAYPDADFQLTLIKGLHEKHKKAFTGAMKKWKGDEHAFYDNPNDLLEGDNEKSKYKRASFKEKVARRASNIFNSHNKSKEERHTKLEKRKMEQKKRLEKKLQARLEEQRQLELRGQQPSKSLKDAVKMLTKQLLVFGKISSQITPESKEDDSRWHENSIFDASYSVYESLQFFE
jgi:hypothetical protein